MNNYILQPNLPTGAQSIVENIYDALNKKESAIKIENLIDKSLNTTEINELLPEEQLTFQLFCELLMDFIRQGWEFTYKENNLMAVPPDELSLKNKNITEIKKKIKKGLEEARNEQLKEPSIKKFIYGLEKPRMFKGRQVSILNHFLKPVDLYNDLLNRLNSPEEVREALIEESIKPYIQLVVTNERDEFTNIKLGDIWRYARYSWSLPLHSKVGRQLRYLIRDAAREFHPIIGIGELANSIAQISCRDEEIGWSLKAMEKSNNIDQRFNALEQALNNTLDSDYYYKDLLDDDEVNNPTDNTIKKLKDIIDKLQPIVSKNKPYKNTSSIIDDTLREDYKLKRAQDLYELLHIRLWFDLSKRQYDSNIDRFNWLMESKDGKRALKNAIRNVKKTHMGATIMDITTCGAIPPYNEVLGGKLVSLLMASPKVINDYNNRYKFAESEIASRKKGEKVVKPANLTLLVTTSLYYTGSSQYNRIKYNTKKGVLKYSYVGKTRGFGSVHISNKTYRTLQNLLIVHPDLKPESNNFSAGVNYKMRTISNGLGYLGLRKLQQHENPRLVYLIPLAENWKDYLVGVDQAPNYLLNVEKPEKDTNEIIKFWKKRWYVGRIKKREIINRLKYSKAIKISDYIGSESNQSPTDTNQNPIQQLELFGGENMIDHQPISWKTLAELKDQRASFAERLEKEELEALHIQTKLDQGLVRLLEENKRIYLVGSPGDGKTHAIIKHSDDFPTNTFINLDASAVDEDKIIDGIIEAIETNSPSIIAVNHGPLRKLLVKLPESEREQVQIQLERPFLYGLSQHEEYSALVVNLGNRQVLTSSLLDEALRIVLKRIDYTDAPSRIKYNVSMLNRDRVKERLKKLLGFLTKSGIHITMHQLLGFFSHIITSGINNKEQNNAINYYFNAVFNQECPLYDYLKNFDPIKITHPLVDMNISDNDHSEIDWLESDLMDISDLGFDDKKRKFFFEAKNGDTILELIPEDYRDFYNLLDNSQRSKQHLAKKHIIEALSLFFGQNVVEKKLKVWTGIKYDSKTDPTVFISSQAIGEDDIEIFTPHVREQVEDLIEYEPSHIRLYIKPNSETGEKVGLDIDLELWIALMKIKKGVSNVYQDPIIVRRLTTLMSQISAQVSNDKANYIEIEVQDTETGATYKNKVFYENEEKGKYIL